MNKEVFLSLKDASLSLGKKKILKAISLSIHLNDKIALVGKNGVGKTTLLNILCEKKKIDDGEFWVNPNLNVANLEQRINKSSDFSVIDYLISLTKRSQSFEEFNIKRITKEIKLDKKKKVNFLSGGEKKKLALAELLLSDPDLLLLDEPTNHLDIESISWLESYLNNEFKGSYLVVSHNRNFLKNVTNKVFWMDRGSIKTSSKGFFDFENWKNLLIEQERRELKNIKQHLDNELEWLNKGIKARRKRNIKRKENVNLLKKSYKEENSEFLKSISRVIIPKESTKIVEGPKILINFINVSKFFIEKEKKINILNDFNYKLIRGDKVGIIGPNGSGKSTFLNLASSKLEPKKGNIKIKKNVEFSFFDQSGEQFDDKKSIKQNLIPSGGDYMHVADKKIHICGYLKNFLFDPKDIDRFVSSLSGGERNRLLLAKILASPREILILDEPTNDLDIETIDLLIDFINLHKGSALISSHDIDFLKKTCQKFFYFDGSGRIKPSNKPQLSSTQKEESAFLKINEKKGKPISNDKLINKVLKKIETKEIQITNLTNKLQKIQDLNPNSLDYKNLMDDLKKTQNELDLLEEEWIEIEENSINNG